MDVGANASGVGFAFVAAGANSAALVEPNNTYYEQSLLYIENGSNDNITSLKSSAFTHTNCRNMTSYCPAVSWPVLSLSLSAAFPGLLRKCQGGIHVISTQTIGGESLEMRNRKLEYLQHPRVTCGWEPSVPMFTAMLQEAGYDVLSYLPASGRWVTDNGFTNNAYFICRPSRSNGLNMDAASAVFSPSRVWI